MANLNEVPPSTSGQPEDDLNRSPISYEQIVTPQPPIISSTPSVNDAGNYVPPDNRPTYTRVQAGQGSKTQVHAVLDYDSDEYIDEENSTGESSFLSFLSRIVQWTFASSKKKKETKKIVHVPCMGFPTDFYFHLSLFAFRLRM